MLARGLSAAVNGIKAFPVEVEVNCRWGHTVIVLSSGYPPQRSARRPALNGSGMPRAGVVASVPFRVCGKEPRLRRTGLISEN